MSALVVSMPQATGCLSAMRLPTQPVAIQPSGGHMSTCVWMDAGEGLGG